MIDTIHTFIFSWKKVTDNAIELYKKASNVCTNTTLINCDENIDIDNTIKNIKLDDSYYYGGQFETAIRAIPDGVNLCCIVGDVSPEANWEEIYRKAEESLSTNHIGVYAPNVDYTWHTARGRQVSDTLYEVPNTDCTFWFIHHSIISVLRDIPYHNLSNLGWGIDTVVNKESTSQNKLIVRDYSELVRQPIGTAYNVSAAREQMNKLISYYTLLGLKKK